jgi:hypothetical protein
MRENSVTEGSSQRSNISTISLDFPTNNIEH